MSTQQAGLVSGNSQNVAGGQTKNDRSVFPLSYSKFQTERFAEYVPFWVMEGVSTDKLPLHSTHQVQTMNLKSPILQSLTKKKDYFMVPMQAILPLNWEKFYTNPNIGEDVPTDCGLGVENFWKTISSKCYESFRSLINLYNEPATVPEFVTRLFRFLLFYEQFFSCGNLLKCLNISGCNYINITRSSGVSKRVTYDEFFDDCVGVINDYLANNPGEYLDLSFGQNTFRVYAASPEVSSSSVLSLREALEMMRDDIGSWSISDVPDGLTLDSFSFIDDYYSFSAYDGDDPLNLGRLWAYQLVCAHYYSNDHVDFIYSADLFRQYILELVNRDYSPTSQFTRFFVVNGLKYSYDALSACYCTRLLSVIPADLTSSSTATAFVDNLNDLFAYFRALLGFNSSLRFLDYFTGSRTRPLAVGDTSVNVNSNKVSVLDMSRSSMMTKFLQAVNRSGRKFGAYMQELFNKTPSYDYHNPLYLSHTSDLVGAQETENTGAAQVSRDIAVTSRFRASSDRYAFEFNPDRDCILIGISYYDIPRVYSRATERQNFYLDRFDMFNPYLQFIGDQPIYKSEIGTLNPTIDPANPFGYTNRNMEYKQRYNQCAGAFCVPSSGLDNWIFLGDVDGRRFVQNQSSSFIRSRNTEIDRFYQSLSGFSLGTYYHFIVRYDNRMDASRPMAYNPTIAI